MTADDVAGLGWLIAGVVLVPCGIRLCRRTTATSSGVGLAAAGACLVALAVLPDGWSGSTGVAAMGLLAAAIATYPRLARDLPQYAALAAVAATSGLHLWQQGSGAADPGEVARTAFVLATVVGGHLWWRLETSDARTRGALLWVLSTASVVLFLVGIGALTGIPAGAAATVHATLGLIGVAAVLGADPAYTVDGRWLASRVAVWFFSLACVFAVATLFLTLVDWFSGEPPGIVAMAVVAAGCGVLWRPLVAVVQRVADGFLFGFRPDALSAAERVAVGIGDDPRAAIRAIQEGLVLPYAALALDGEETLEVGVPTDARRVFPIDLGGEHVGDLVVGVRPGDLGLSRDDERVLTLALPILVQTIKARSLAESLQRERVARAAAREEERRRLRRDLHDGLGPRLTGIAFTVDAAMLAGAGDAAVPMLDRIRREAEVALEEIRELVYGLRPPALDEVGLVGAIRLRTEALGGGLSVAVDAPDLGRLPAAVEVAAYRIALEALTNVVRHSGATQAAVALRADPGCLRLEVWDDGPGTGDWVPGIGLSSMAERASELGGRLDHHRTATGSTVVALLPLGPPLTATRPDGDATDARE